VLFQSRLLTEIFTALQASRSGRHQGPIVGEGAVEMPADQEHEFGDSVTHMDIPGSMVNANDPQWAGPADTSEARRHPIIHRTRNNPKCATAAARHERLDALRGQYNQRQRMGRALDGSSKTDIRAISCSSSRCTPSPSRGTAVGRDSTALMPKPVTPLRSRGPAQGGHEQPEHQRAAVAAALYEHPACAATGPALPGGARHAEIGQIVLITDGLPTAHFEGENILLLYPPDPPHREGDAARGHALRPARGSRSTCSCCRAGTSPKRTCASLTSWSKSTRGRVFFTAGRELDRFVVWDYIKRRKQIIS